MKHQPSQLGRKEKEPAREKLRELDQGYSPPRVMLLTFRLSSLVVGFLFSVGEMRGCLFVGEYMVEWN